MAMNSRRTTLQAAKEKSTKNRKPDLSSIGSQAISCFTVLRIVGNSGSIRNKIPWQKKQPSFSLAEGLAVHGTASSPTHSVGRNKSYRAVHMYIIPLPWKYICSHVAAVLYNRSEFAVTFLSSSESADLWSILNKSVEYNIHFSKEDRFVAVLYNTLIGELKEVKYVWYNITSVAKSPSKDVHSLKGSKRVVPAHRRAKARGVSLQDNVDDDGN